MTSSSTAAGLAQPAFSRTWWRVLFLVVGCVATVAVVVLAVLWPPVIVDAAGNISYLPDTALDTREVAVQWLVAFAATVAFGLASWGTVPDKCALLVPLGVIVNIILGTLASGFGLPFYSDTVGSMIAAIVGGPVLGIFTATLTMVVWGFNNPLIIPHLMSAVILAAVVGVCAVRLRFNTMEKVLAIGLGLGLFLGIVGWLTSLGCLGGLSTPATQAIADFFVLIHMPPAWANLVQALISNGLDKVFALIVAVVVVRFAPAKLKDNFRFIGNEYRLNNVLWKHSESELAKTAAH